MTTDNKADDRKRALLYKRAFVVYLVLLIFTGYAAALWKLLFS